MRRWIIKITKTQHERQYFYKRHGVSYSTATATKFDTRDEAVDFMVHTHFDDCAKSEVMEVETSDETR